MILDRLDDLLADQLGGRLLPFQVVGFAAVVVALQQQADPLAMVVDGGDEVARILLALAEGLQFGVVGAVVEDEAAPFPVGQAHERVGVRQHLRRRGGAGPAVVVHQMEVLVPVPGQVQRRLGAADILHAPVEELS